MTNTRIKSIFKKSYLYLFVFYILMFAFKLISNDWEYARIDRSLTTGMYEEMFIMFLVFALIPVVIVVILRVYNLLVYGKYSIEEGKE